MRSGLPATAAILIICALLACAPTPSSGGGAPGSGAAEAPRAMPQRTVAIAVRGEPPL